MKPKAPRIAIRRVDAKTLTGASTLAWLHMKTFPEDLHPSTDVGWWWVAYEGENPVAFAGLQAQEGVGGYLVRCGVLKSHRGRGLQGKLLRLREAKAKSLGFKSVTTTTYANPASSNNLIAAGYRMYSPENPTGTEGTNYWIKKLT